MSGHVPGGQAQPVQPAGRTVSGRWLHVAHVVASLALVVAVLAGRDLVWWQLAGGLVLALASAARPDSPAPAALLVGTVLVQLDHLPASTGGGAPGWRTVALVMLVHLVHLLASLCAVVPVRAEVEPAALAPSGRRYLQVQVAVLLVFAVVVLLPVVPVSVPALLVAGVAVVALATLPLALIDPGGAGESDARQ